MEKDFSEAVDRLAGRVKHWTPTRWTRASATGGTRAELVHGLAQRLADVAADAEGRPRRPVPRLDHDVALTDQLRVLASDLLAAAPSPDALREATAAVRETAGALS